MERKIGEIFECNGEWYQCIPDTTDDNCNNRFFQKRCSDIVGDCSSTVRSDGKSVAFKKLEKTGEPLKINGKAYQGLISPYEFNNCSLCAFKNISCKEVIPCYDDYIFIEIKQNKEDMEEKKLNLKPFDIQKAREGKPVCTRDGRKARIICFDSNGGRPIVALVTECDDEEEIPYKYHCDGSYNCQSIPSDKDLMMLPEKRIGWITINKDAGLFKSKEEAERYCTKDYATVRVEFEI